VIGPFAWNTGKEFVSKVVVSQETSEGLWLNVANEVGMAVHNCVERCINKIDDIAESDPRLKFVRKSTIDHFKYIAFRVALQMPISSCAITSDSKNKPTRVGGVNRKLSSRRRVFLNVRGDIQIQANSATGRKYSNLRALRDQSLYIQSMSDLWSSVPWTHVGYSVPYADFSSVANFASEGNSVSPYVAINALTESKQTVWIVPAHIESALERVVIELFWLLHEAKRFANYNWAYNTYPDRGALRFANNYSSLVESTKVWETIRDMGRGFNFWGNDQMVKYLTSVDYCDVFKRVALPVYHWRPLYAVREEASAGWQQAETNPLIWNVDSRSEIDNVTMGETIHRIKGIPMDADGAQIQRAKTGLNNYCPQSGLVQNNPKKVRRAILDSEVTNINYREWSMQRDEQIRLYTLELQADRAWQAWQVDFDNRQDESFDHRHV